MTRACDRCYRIKVRCTFSNATTCDRCARLFHSCRTERGVLRPGRPHRKTTPDPKSSPTAPKVVDVDVQQDDNDIESGSNLVLSPIVPLNPFASAISDFTAHEISLIDRFFDKDHLDWFAASLLFGPSFQENLKSTIAQIFLLQPNRMKDALLACLGALDRTRETRLLNISWEETIKRHSRGLRALSMTKIGHIEDVEPSLALALALMTVNDIAIGQPSLPITRSALLLVAPFRDTLIRSELCKSLIGVLYPEMEECLIHREIPVFRYEHRPPTRLDRYYGICHELLPLLYDICVLGNAMKTNEISIEAANERSIELFTQIDAWEPIVPDDQEIVSQEQKHILLQAEAYKVCAQLLCLRMQSQSSFREELIQLLAKQLRDWIVTGFEPSSPSVQYLSFPYFVACLELQDKMKQQEVFFRLTQITNGKASSVCTAMYEFLRFIWRAKSENNGNLNWYDFVESGPPLVIGP